MIGSLFCYLKTVNSEFLRSEVRKEEKEVQTKFCIYEVLMNSLGN